MASQRIIIATLAGEAATIAAQRFDHWRNAAEPAAIDRFCVELRENSTSLQVLYFSEWIDRWLMGNEVPGPRAVEGRRFEATCLSCEESLDWARRCGRQFEEQKWLSARLREAATAWSSLTDRLAVAIVREVFDGSATDEEIQAALYHVPGWLTQT